MEVKKGRKRISIAFSVEDNDMLYSIQQSYLYSGKSPANIWQLGDIIKGVLVETGKNIVLGDIENINTYLRPFLELQKIHLSDLPASRVEFVSRVTSYLSSLDNSPLINTAILWLKRPYPKTDSIPQQDMTAYRTNAFDSDVDGTDFSSSAKTTAFILFLNSEEADYLEIIRLIIQAYLPEEIPYSTLIKTLFRTKMISLNNQKFESIPFNFYIYMGSLYDFSPVDSLLIFSSLKEFLTIKVSKSSLETLKHLNRDLIIMQGFLKDVREELSQPKKVSENERKIKDIEYTIDLANIPKNRERDDRFRSAIAGFGFHSAFIGLVLLHDEFVRGEHKLPLLATYLEGYSSIPFAKISNKIVFQIYTFLLDELFNIAYFFQS